MAKVNGQETIGFATSGTHYHTLTSILILVLKCYPPHKYKVQWIKVAKMGMLQLGLGKWVY